MAPDGPGVAADDLIGGRPAAAPGLVAFSLDGTAVEVRDDGGSLLDALREQLGRRTAKDGCSPQGQCGCCTVWVDGAARVSCVTPVRRVGGRSVTTVDGLPPETSRRWAEAFVATGGSQCGFCTPGIVMRLAALEGRHRAPDEPAVRTALLAHLCRCTGWQSILDAAMVATASARAAGPAAPVPVPVQPRDSLLCAWRAQVEGPMFQSSTAAVVLGGGRFADDTAPPGALVAIRDGEGGYSVGDTLADARRHSRKVQGRNSSAPLRHPVALPEGPWDLVLQTTWVEPAYLEPDASWCLPGGLPASPLANGGAFGGKRRSPVPAVAEDLARRRGQAVRVLWTREDVVRWGPKRPPVALGLRRDGSGVMRVATTPGSPDLAAIGERVASVLPGVAVEVVTVAGPPVGPELRGAGWAEAAVAAAVLDALSSGRTGPGVEVEVRGPAGGRARVALGADGEVHVEVWAGEVLDEVTLRSYCFGAVHQALGWVWAEGIAVDEAGVAQDLTMRSFGVLSARDTPNMTVVVHQEDRVPVNGSDAVFAATAAAAWLAEGLPPRWPTRRTDPRQPAGVRQSAVAGEGPG